jgi:hypothetical protein
MGICSTVGSVLESAIDCGYMIRSVERRVRLALVTRLVLH